MQRCLQDTMKTFRQAFLTQMPNNGLQPAEMERLDADISDLRAFFSRHASPPPLFLTASSPLFLTASSPLPRCCYSLFPCCCSSPLLCCSSSPLPCCFSSVSAGCSPCPFSNSVPPCSALFVVGFARQHGLFLHGLLAGRYLLKEALLTRMQHAGTCHQTRWTLGWRALRRCSGWRSARVSMSLKKRLASCSWTSSARHAILLFCVLGCRFYPGQIRLG